jgi:hypothetical protein
MVVVLHFGVRKSRHRTMLSWASNDGNLLVVLQQVDDLLKIEFVSVEGR